MPPTRPVWTWVAIWAWGIALLAICVRVGYSPHRQSVYAADYVRAGWHWLHGAEVYKYRQGFIYSPPTAAFFAPFSMFADPVSGILWRLFGAGCLLGAAVAWLGSDLAGLGRFPAAGKTAGGVSVGCLLFLPLAVGNMNLGQMNVLILALVAVSVLAARRQSWTLAAVLIALATFVKIYPLALGLLLVTLYPRQFSWRLASALAALFVLSFGLQHPSYVWREYGQWFATLGGDRRLDNGLYLTWRDFGYLLRVCGVPVSDRAYRAIEILAGGGLALFLFLGQRRGGWSQEKLLGGVFCLGCAWMMLFGPATEAATYVVLALPVCGALVAAWSLPSGFPVDRFVVSWRVLLTTTYVLLLLADLLNGWWQGHTRHLFTRTLQPMAALLFTGNVVWLLLRGTPAASTVPLPAAAVSPILADGNVSP